VIYRIDYADAARTDLREISSYLRNAAGDAVARAVIDKVIEAAESLSTRPNRQRLRNELGPGLRGLSVGNYIIFYRVLGDGVSIVRILHGSRNMTAKLFSPATGRP
jgi:toxin ParE1/3/4